MEEGDRSRKRETGQGRGRQVKEEGDRTMKKRQGRRREDKEDGEKTRTREIEQGREDNGEGTRKTDRGQGGDICNIVPRTSSS